MLNEKTLDISDIDAEIFKIYKYKLDFKIKV